MDSVPAWLNPCTLEGHASGTWAASEFRSAEVPEPMGDHDEYWRGDREVGTLVHCCGNVKWCSHCGRQFGGVAPTVKSLPAMQARQVLPPGQEDPLETGTVTHSSILPWRIPWSEEPGGLQPMVWQRVRHD